MWFPDRVSLSSPFDGRENKIQLRVSTAQPLSAASSAGEEDAEEEPVITAATPQRRQQRSASLLWAEDFVDLSADAPMDRPGVSARVPFTYDLATVSFLEQPTPVLARCVEVSRDGKWLILGNNWDDSVKSLSLATSVNVDAMLSRPKEARNR